MGPAGYTLAHHLMNDGHQRGRHRRSEDRTAAGRFAGVAQRRRARTLSIRCATSRDIDEPLDERIMAGFGGVAEYGITVRWDKNFLKIDPPAAGAARAKFRMFGGVRFGGTLTRRQRLRARLRPYRAVRGAGRPTVLDMPNGLARGVRTGVGFPDGAAAHRRGQGNIRSPTCNCACRWS